MGLFFGGGRKGCKVTLYGFIDVSLYTSWINRINYILLMLLMFSKHLAHSEPHDSPARQVGPLFGPPGHADVQPG